MKKNNYPSQNQHECLMDSIQTLQDSTASSTDGTVNTLVRWWRALVPPQLTTSFSFLNSISCSNQRHKKCCMVIFQEKREERLSFLIISQSPRCLGPTYAQLLRVKSEKESRGPFPVLGNIIKERYSGMMPYSEHGTNTGKSLESTRDAISP